ncbi:hypothetical protein D1BOALGB6SA_9181 [Olavius sp. associated proteobacterium Delta 1]|nr:hypothetical protein D1BOALGB6SA_9181 [Olavius sp. associated proteobacterium Delta 1]
MRIADLQMEIYLDPMSLTNQLQFKKLNQQINPVNLIK